MKQDDRKIAKALADRARGQMALSEAGRRLASAHRAEAAAQVDGDERGAAFARADIHDAERTRSMAEELISRADAVLRAPKITLVQGHPKRPTRFYGGGVALQTAPPPARSAILRATRWIETVEVFVSPRIAREELGDALENLRRFEREGRPRWHIYVHAIICGVLAVWHTWLDVVAAAHRTSG